MKTEILLSMVALFSGLLCSCNGSPMNKKTRKTAPPIRTTNDSYTPEEENFIIDELLARGKLLYSAETWEEIALTHTNKRESHVKGFSQERSDMGLFRHFFKTMMKKGKRPKSAVVVPDSLRRLLRPTLHRYTSQEIATVDRELLEHTGSKLNSRQLWKDISIKINRQEGTPGYPAIRSGTGLHSHFLRRMKKTPHLISNDLKKKYAPYFAGLEGESSQGSCDATGPSSSALIEGSQEDHTQVQASMVEELGEPEVGNEDTYEFWAGMIEELRDTEETSEGGTDFPGSFIDELLNDEDLPF